MRYRPLTDIFPVGYPYLPSEVEVRRKCRQWLDIAHDEYNLLIITGQINQIVNPYLKEFTTVVMHNLLLKEAADPSSDYRLSSACLEALENDFRRIINSAWDEQIQGEKDAAYEAEEEQRIGPTPAAALFTTARMDRLEEQMAYLMQEVQNMKRQPDKNDSAIQPAKFLYIRSDNPAEIKDIEDTMRIYIAGNKPSELCTYLFENEGQLFKKMPKHADVVFSCISDRWGDENIITKKGLRTAWNRLYPASL